MLLLIIACLTADPTTDGPDFDGYFAKQDETKATQIKTLQTKITQLDAAIEVEPLRQRKGALKAELLKMEKALDAAQAAPPHRRTLPLFDSLHFVGDLPECTVVAIVDDTTAIVSPRRQNLAQHRNIVLTHISTKELRLRQPYKTNLHWHISAVQTEDKALLAILTADNPYDIVKKGGYYIVEPLSDSQVTEARQRYDKKKKGQPKED